jgi:8-oxo-dGTP diphosphatase
MAAGVALLDDERRILIVKPTYRPTWLVPGGVVEEHESPRAACRREVREELGLDVEIGRLLCVEYGSAARSDGDYLHCVFFGGILSPAQLQAIALDSTEIEEFRLVRPDEALAKLDERLAARIALALSALGRDGAIYAEDGAEQPPGASGGRPAFSSRR